MDDKTGEHADQRVRFILSPFPAGSTRLHDGRQTRIGRVLRLTSSIALLGAVALTADVAAAAPGWGAITAPAPGAVVSPGTTVEVSWGDVPEGTRELELPLTLDGAGSAWVRLTEQLPPGTRSHR